MPDNDPIVFKDMIEREEAERRRLQARKFAIEKAEKRGPIHEELKKELKEITDKLSLRKDGNPVVLDPLFKGVQAAINETINPDTGDHVGGKLPSQQKQMPTVLTEGEKVLTAVYGLLENQNQTDPPVLVKVVYIDNGPTGLVVLPDERNPTGYRRFRDELALASSAFYANKTLFEKVLPILIEVSDPDANPYYYPRPDKPNVVRADQWAGVVKLLIAQGVKPDDLQLRVKVVAALENLIGGEDGPPSNIVIDLPDLEAATDVEIVEDNLNAMQAIYFAMMLEELRIFQVVDKLAELFQMGMLPFGRGPAGDFFYKYWKSSAERISEVERRNVYARAFGYAGGDALDGNPNRQFSDSWVRFASVVSSFVRQQNVDELLRSGLPAPISQEQIRKAGRDLAANLSLHGYGITYFVATDLQNQLREFIAILSNDEVKMAYGARDMWQVIDQVSALELGGARNSVRYRTMATAGAVIIRWLARNARKLAGSSFTDVLDVNEIRFPAPRPAGEKATTHPTDADLVNACEQWLAVTGTQDQQVETYAQPVEGPNQTSRPIQIPTIAKELLESVGVQAGLPARGYTNGKTHY